MISNLSASINQLEARGIFKKTRFPFKITKRGRQPDWLPFVDALKKKKNNDGDSTNISTKVDLTVSVS